MIFKDNYFHHLSSLRSHKMPNVRTLTDPQNAYMGNIILNIETGVFYGFNGTDWIILGNSTSPDSLTSPSSIGASFVINSVAPSLTVRTLESSDGSIAIIENANTFDIIAATTIDIVDDLPSPPDIDLSTDYTLFDNPASFSLDGSLNPQYLLGNPDTSIEKNLALLNPKSGNVTIKTSLGSFNLTFDHQYEKLVFDTDAQHNLWKKLTSSPYYVTTQQGTKLVGSGIVALSRQGTSVSLSADGNTLAVGAYADDEDGLDVGATWVYIRTSNTSWSIQDKLIGTGFINSSQQGFSVSLSADGNTLAIGGNKDNTFQGATWVFTRTAGVWTQQTLPNPLRGINNMGAARQGNSVSLSADGNTLAVGGVGDNSLQGATWIFTRFAGMWTQQTITPLRGINNIGAAFQGNSVSLSADGNTLAIGGPRNNSLQGATWVYTRSAGIWTQQTIQPLIGTGNTGAAFQGSSVSLSANGNTLAVGGSGNNNDIGATWIFTRNSGVWTQQTLLPLIGTGYTGAAEQGDSVSLSADGNTLAVGGSGNDISTGATWMFTRSSGGVWTQQDEKLLGNGYVWPSQQGNSVSLSADGNTLAVGGPEDNNFTGATWIFI